MKKMSVSIRLEARVEVSKGDLTGRQIWGGWSVWNRKAAKDRKRF